MNPREFFHSMTDDQLAEWHQRVRQVDRLNALLLEEQKKNAALVAQVDNLNHHLASEREDRRADIERVREEARHTFERLVTANTHLATLTRELPAVLADFLLTWEPFSEIALTGEMRSKLQSVRVMMQLLEELSS